MNVIYTIPCLTNLYIFFVIRYTYGQPVRGKVDILVHLSNYRPGSDSYSNITKMEEVSFDKIIMFAHLYTCQPNTELKGRS